MAQLMIEQKNNLRIITPEESANFVALPGQTVRNLLNQCPEWKDHNSLAVYNHGLLINDVDGFVVNEGDRLIICVVPEGGGGGNSKGIIGSVIGIVMIAVGTYFGQPWLVSMGTGMLLNSVGSMLSPKPSLGTGNRLGTSEKESSYFLSSQSNSARPYSPVLVAYGRNKIYPLVCANPNFINIGKDSTFDCLYDFGIGEQSYDLGSVKFGDTLASEYSPKFYRHQNTKTPNLQLITNRFGYQDFSVLLNHNSPFTATTKDNTFNAEVNLTFNKGLCHIDDQGTTQPASSKFKVEWRATGSEAWNLVKPDAFYGANAKQDSYAPQKCLYGWIQSTSFYGSSYETFRYQVSPTAYDFIGRTVKDVSIRSQKIGDDGIYQLLTFYEYDFNEGIWLYNQVVLMSSDELWESDDGQRPTPPKERYRWERPYTNSVAPVLHDDVIVSAATTAPFVVVVSINFPYAAKYDVRITRTSPIATDNRTQDGAVFSLLESRTSGNVLNLKAPHTMLEMRVSATERLSGVVQNLSAICTSVLNFYDAYGNIVGRIPTRNPAWIAIDILTGKANPRPIRHDQIDWPAWKRLADICDSQREWNINGKIIRSERFTCDVVIDYETTIKQLIESVLSTCRSSITIGLNGRYSVMFDGERTIPRQVITPSNSWGFSGTRQFLSDTHALKVSFEDEESDYKKQEVIVYSDGYSNSNADKFEDLGTMGIRTYHHAWAYGRYMMAAAINRAEVFTINMDVENLACQRGDLVHVAHDVPKVGGKSARVVSVIGNLVEVTEEFSSAPTAYTVRQSDGTIRQGIATIINSNTFQLDNVAGISADDLIVLGEAERVVKGYIVAQISSGSDLSATLTLLPYVSAVYDADIGMLPAWQPEISNDLINSSNLSITSVVSGGQILEYLDRMPKGKFIVTWSVNSERLVSAYDFIVIFADGSREIFTGISNKFFEYKIDLVRHPSRYGKVTFEVIPLTAAGIAGKKGFTIDVISPDRMPPKTVNWFLVNVQDMNIALSWDPPKEPDILEYELRYSPMVIGARWSSSQIIGKFPHNVTRTMIGARTGTYEIIVRDTSGNISNISTKRTTIEKLPNINLIESINDYPNWSGTLAGSELDGGNPSSSGDWGSVVQECFYYYEHIFDAGSIYELRISSKLQAHGSRFEDFMINWVPLSSVSSLSSVKSSQFSATLEVRTANEANFINDWTPIESAKPIGGLNLDAWSEWRPCEVGDFTGRFFHFRIRLQSFDSYVKSVIDDGLIEIDVRDRIDSFSDLPVPQSGLTVNFDPAFMEPPTLAITTENSLATRYDVSNKTRTSFDINLFDENGNAVSGQIDVLALGYGREKPTRI
jgi:predicted phage tail protein